MQIVLDPSRLSEILIDPRISQSDVDRVELTVNGTLVRTIPGSALEPTPLGLDYTFDTALDGGGAWTGKSLLRATACQVSDVSRIEDASLSYSSLHGWDERGRLDDFLSLSRRVWRTRAYGDFWSYMMVAEGSVDIATEPQLELYDMAALDVIVREAGGYFTSLDGEPGPTGGSALATNGKLHDQALAFLGSLPDEHEPRTGGTVHDLSARRGEPVPEPEV